LLTEQQFEFFSVHQVSMVFTSHLIIRQYSYIYPNDKDIWTSL